MTLMAAVD